MAGFRMVNWGYCRQKHSRKWRCPLACGKAGSCPCKQKCSSSSYGRCVYTKPDWVLNDYHLHDMGIHTRKRYSFFTMMICINIHLDARLKMRTKQEP